jgi:prepilin-type N-terminal cleavage/methylation domain-containing protein
MITRRARTAFTLIELLAASALAALLMLVLFQVIGSLGRTRAAMTHASRAAGPAPASQSAWKTDLLDVLRWDLANASTIQLEANQLTLEGTAALDRRSLAVGQEPVTIVYAIERRGGRSCLVRRQSTRGMLRHNAEWSELVGADVTAFELAPVRAKSVLNLPTASTRFPIRVRIDGPAGLLLDEMLVVR